MIRQSRHGVFYDGKGQHSCKPNTLSIANPATGDVVKIAASCKADVDLAIESAAKAFIGWSKTSPNERSQILLRAASLLRQRNDELAKQETLDTGKPFSETSTVDITTGADVVDYYAKLVASGGLNGERISLRPDAWAYTTKEPLGVCAGIGAFNYPIQIALWKSAPCLAAGNCMVYKASEFTPLHAQTLAELYIDAGLPAGVFNVVCGGGDIGAHLISHEDIAKVSFTGSVTTGQKVASIAGAGLKYCTMELGGKSPLLILPDADVESAVDGAMMANFYSTGQVCTNGTRVFVPEEMKAAFEKRLEKMMDNVRAGDLMDPRTNFGPLVSRVHQEKVWAYMKHGIEVDKAHLLYGGLGLQENLPDNLKHGFWARPTVFTDCHDDMRIVREEIFGPVMTILTYKTVEEAIERANKTKYGLAAGVFSQDLRLAHSVVSRLEAGITWINTWGESPAEMSVGGWKQSGLGVENGIQGLQAWTQNRSTLLELSGQIASVFKP